MKYRDRKPALRAAALAAAALMGLGLCSIPAAAEEEPQIQVITQTASSSALVFRRRMAFKMPSLACWMGMSR